MVASPYTQTIGSYPVMDDPADGDVLLLQRGTTPGQYFRLSLATLEAFVATSGASAWGDITGTLSDQTDLQTALKAKVNTSALASVATSGAYADLSGKPTIPTLVSQLTNDTGFITTSALSGYAPNSGATLTGASVNGVTLTTGGGTTNFLRADGTYAAPPGGGGITAPGTTTNTALVRWSGTVGAAVLDSGILVDGSNNVTGMGTLASGNQTITGTVAITTNAAAAFAVGQNGATNPAFRVVTNAFTPAVNGIELVARPAGSGVIFNVISSFATEALTFNSKGAADITFNAGNTNNFQVSGVTRGSISATNYTFSGLTGIGTATPKFNYAAPSGDASITASTNAPNVRFNMNQQRVHSTGALTLQTDFLIDASEHRFNGASALTDMAAFAINGAPVAGTNNTTTNTSTIYSAGQNVVNGTGACTNSYGLNISANTGATNNYVAKFGAGVIQQGTTTVAALIAAATAGAGARSMVSDALSPVFGTAVTGGGAVVVPVYSNGTNWMVG